MSSVPPPPPPPPPGGGDFNAPPPPPSGNFGAQPPAAGGAPMQNYLVLTIIGTVLGLFCCDIIGAIPGIIGIVFATQVNKLAAAGDIAGAQAKANQAKILGIVSIALGAVGLVINIIALATGNWNVGSN
jgi:hypothetical protein